MSHLVSIERTFAARGQADQWFDSLRSTAWPYVWCTRDPVSRKWTVKALVEKRQLGTVMVDPDLGER